MSKEITKERYWNYRVVKRGNLYAVHEVHYTDGSKIEFISENPVPVEAGTREDVKWVMRMMEANWCLPVIDYETLEEIYEDSLSSE
jgi:hypothetical protein